MTTTSKNKLGDMEPIPSHNMANFLTTEEAAQYMALSVKTLESWRLKGIGPTYSKFGRSVRYRVCLLDDFANSASKEALRKEVQ